MPYLQLMRPAQWTKNLFLFAGVIFGQKLTDAPSVYQVLLGFVCFCLLSSMVYVVNDIHDRNEDRLHPRKRERPIARGAVTPAAAGLCATLLLVIGLGGALLLDRGFFVTAGFIE